MGKFDDIPEDFEVPHEFRNGYSRLVWQLVKFFSLDKRNGNAVINFQEGAPKVVEPTPRITIDR